MAERMRAGHGSALVCDLDQDFEHDISNYLDAACGEDGG